MALNSGLYCCVDNVNDERYFVVGLQIANY